MNCLDDGALNKRKSDGKQSVIVVPIVSLNCISLVDQKFTLNGVTLCSTHQNEATLPSNIPLLTGNILDITCKAG